MISTIQVLLCANNRPVLNDVTYAELVLIVQRAARVSPVIEKSLKSGKLLCLNSGICVLHQLLLVMIFALRLYIMISYKE